MASRRRMGTVVAVAAAVALVASACGRSAGGNAASGNISATKSWLSICVVRGFQTRPKPSTNARECAAQSISGAAK